MKKPSTIILLSALALSAYALPELPQRDMLQHAGKSSQTTTLTSGVTAKSSVKRAEAGSPDVIFDVEGTPATYTRSGDAYAAVGSSVFMTYQDGISLQTVTADDGKTIYFEDLVSQLVAGTWVKGTIDGNKITVPLGQYIAYWPDSGYGYQIYAGKYTVVEGSETFIVDPTITEATFSVYSDGSIALDYPFVTDFGVWQPEIVLGIFQSDNLAWTGNADWNSYYTPMADEITVMPEDIEAQEYLLTYEDADYGFERKNQFVYAGIKDDKLYVAGVLATEPNSVWIGDIEGNKVSFPTDQFLDFSGGFNIYAVPATYEIVTYTDPDTGQEGSYPRFTLQDVFVFDYNAESHTLTPAVEQSAILLNINKKELGSAPMNRLANPTIKQYVETAATPATPSIYAFEDHFEADGYYAVGCDIPTVDTEGNYIDPENLYYIIWNLIGTDTFEYEFYSEDFPYIATWLEEESITEVPYWFYSPNSHGYDGIMEAGVRIYIPEAAPDNIGVQAVYYGGNERHVSEISWFSTTGVDSNFAPAATIEAIYGIDGVARTSIEKGLNIVKMTDGSVRKIFK